MTNEHPDPETALYKELAKIEDFKKEVRSLKKRLGKVEGQTESFKLIDFQKQLDHLDERITKLSDELTAITNQQAKGLLEVAQLTAAFEINSAVGDLRNIIDYQLSDSNTLITQLVVDASNAKSKAMASKKPYSTVTEFKNKWKKRLLELGADIIES